MLMCENQLLQVAETNRAAPRSIRSSECRSNGDCVITLLRAVVGYRRHSCRYATIFGIQPHKRQNVRGAICHGGRKVRELRKLQKMPPIYVARAVALRVFCR
jgi:hypothetical protein